MQTKVSIVAVLAFGGLLAGLSAGAYADSVRADGFPYNDDLVVIGLKDGQLHVQIKGGDKFFDLKKVEQIQLSGQPTFNDAEQNRKDAKKSAALYKRAIPNINDHRLKALAELRAIGPTDADGRWSEAVADFLEAYAASPTDEVWNLHPTNIPAASSSMLKESADRILASVASFHTEECKKNLNTMALELLTKANDPRAAALARKLGTGEPSPAANVAPSGAAASEPVAAGAADTIGGGGGVAGVNGALRARSFDVAVTRADQALKTATGDTAIQLFQLKAQALEGQKKLEDAAATLIRISAYYPGSGAAPIALRKAADIQKALKHDDEAKHLYQEIVDKYPNSADFIYAKSQPGVIVPPPVKP